MIILVLQCSAVALLSYYVYRWLTRVSLDDLRGPPSKSFLTGNIIDIFADTTGMQAVGWQKEYGTLIRLHPQIGTREAIMVSDPSALRYIHQSDNSDHFIRAPEWYAMADLLAGESIGSAEGDAHKRQRKGIRPAFGVPETRALLPVFNSIAQKLCEKWENIIDSEGGNGSVVNVSSWISKAALDGFGEVAFDYQFGALDGIDNELAKAMPSVLLETFGSPTAAQLVLVSMLQHIPSALVKWILNKAPSERFAHVRNTNAVSQRIILQLLDDRRRMGANGRRDIMSIILKSGANEDPSARLSDYEIVSQLRFLLLAGQETSANSLAWTLYQLVHHPKIQSELRREIRAMRAKCNAQDFSAQDLQNMPLLNAVIKEVLRFIPVIQTLFKEAGQDDVLPLACPITLKSGKVINKLPIPKGTKIYSSIAAYNMNPEVWGQDAETFNPQRWLKQDLEQSNTLGMYANLMTFSAGTKGCIGWRFAILQLQNLLAELIDKFEFSLPEKPSKILRANCMATCPMVEGESDKGAQLPLLIRRAP